MSIGICHGDLKPSNMMISDENKVFLRVEILYISLTSFAAAFN
jgi:tRNA A-37 threonylcarbamoyl transferase component Bud32